MTHGTTAGYYRHRRAKEDPCDPCRDAINEYFRDYRDRPEVGRNKTREAARRKATALLRSRHREEYEELIESFYAEEVQDT